MPKDKRFGKAKKAELDRCISEIGGIRERLDGAYVQFNSASDPDALDACIFEINALRSRYNTAVRHYKNTYY
ncbi:MAG: hypothetical protein LBL15_08120 [Oscillospiraceae bacterium]|jgi:hypothetical protein|nr:hypothetical protein [Oscillospiraceae bacterium]